jgi:hypothetical protein
VVVSRVVVVALVVVVVARVVDVEVVARVVVVVPRVVVVVVVARVVVVVINGAAERLTVAVGWTPFQLPKQGVDALAATFVTVAWIELTADADTYELLAVQLELLVEVAQVLLSLVPLLKLNLTVIVSGTRTLPHALVMLTVARIRHAVLVASE